MSTQPHRSFLTVEEYLELDRNSMERYEYVDGQVRMLAGGTGKHSAIEGNVIVVLKGLLRGSSCRVFTSNMRLWVSPSRYLYPDASVSCDGRDRYGEMDIMYFPRLVVEVLSPSTEAVDRKEKFDLYRGCPTIQEYMLVNTKRPLVEVFRREKNGLWTVASFELNDEVQLNSIDVHFPAADLYEGVDF
jgi:Uma2 family endonuclease